MLDLPPPYVEYQIAREKLSAISQTHLLHYFEELSEGEKNELLQQISALDEKSYRLQREKLAEPVKKSSFALFPYEGAFRYSEGRYSTIGKRLLANGKVGALLLAGGEGTRLGYSGPKGCFPISLTKKKSLFQLFAEKALYAGKRAGCPLPLAIMTSPKNCGETVAFFRENGYFGLSPSQLYFFQQSELPLLDGSSNLFLQKRGEIARGASGNGAVFDHFVKSGIYESWRALGIENVNIIPIDNPLADPFDEELIGLHSAEECEVTIKCVERIDPKESVGVICKDDRERVRVVEYSEIDEEERTALTDEGALLHKYANISLFCIGMDFMKRVAENSDEFLPYHIAFKAADFVDGEGRCVRSRDPMAYKYEKYIFDMLPCSERVAALVYDRKQCFSPLKNGKGKDSIESVRGALLESDRRQWQAVTGSPPPPHGFELSQEFYYPTEEFIERWRGRGAGESSYYE